MAAAVYQLKSELARVCLPTPERSADRRLAWINSICALFLLIGIAGAQSSLPPRKAPPPLEQPVPIIVEPLPPEAVQIVVQQQPQQQNDQDKPDVPSVVAVTLDSPAINFAVPTPGALLVPASVAPTPPAASLRQAVAVARHEPVKIESTGVGGARPAPYPYPPIAEQMGQQGTVVLLLTVDDAGKVVSAAVQETSGSIILDSNAQDFVRRHWIVPPFHGGHQFLAPIRYTLH
jgi:TonB family protein